MVADIRDAVAYVLFAWALAGGITLAAYLAVSVANFRSLVRTAALAAAPAMWLPAAALLLATRSATGEMAGVGLIAGSVCMLCSRRVPRRWDKHSRGPDPARSAIFGAFAMELGGYALWRGLPFVSATCVAAGAAVWTYSARAREASLPRGIGSGRWLAPIAALAVMSTAWLLMAGQHLSHAGESGLWGTTVEVAKRLWYVAPADLEVAKAQNATRVFSAHAGEAAPIAEGVPGVVFRSKKKAERRAAVLLPGRPRPLLADSASTTIPFTGEYRVFRTSSGTLPAGAIAQAGTPLEAAYRTTDGGSIETEAYQSFEAPLDITRCGKVRITLSNGEGSSLTFASLELLGAGRRSDLGSALFGLAGPKETVDFNVPVLAANFRVNAIRVVFHTCNPDALDKSVKVAIEGFTFLGQ